MVKFIANINDTDKKNVLRKQLPTGLQYEIINCSKESVLNGDMSNDTFSKWYDSVVYCVFVIVVFLYFYVVN